MKSFIPPPPTTDTLPRHRWAILIQHIYHADPLLCPNCGGAMKIIAVIGAHQDDVIRKMLEHCGPLASPHPSATSSLILAHSG